MKLRGHTPLSTLALTALAVWLGCVEPGSAAPAYRIPSAYQAIAQVQRVPVDIWFALLQQESCRVHPGLSQCLPWPWTLNIGGQGHYYDRREEMTTALRRAIVQGQAVAIGPGQIYWPAHHPQFEHPEHLIDIATNLTYSAFWLRHQYDISGDWWQAVGRYHAPNKPTAARLYQARVRQRWEAHHGKT